MAGKICWLVSYPKSGNTWVRILLSHLLAEDAINIDINNLLISDTSYGRSLYESHLGVKSDLLTSTEIDNLRPAVYEAVSKNAEGLQFIKVHEKYFENQEGVPVFPAKASYGAIYIVRNPLDVAVSMTNHANIELGQAIKILSDEDYDLVGLSLDDYFHQIHQPISSWSTHVKSWVAQTEIPLLILKFEEMVEDIDLAVSRIIQFLDIQVSQDRISSAIEKSDFKRIQKEESNLGFNEKYYQTERFFWMGKVGYWRKIVNFDQANVVIHYHREMMDKLDYLNKDGSPKY